MEKKETKLSLDENKICSKCKGNGYLPLDPRKKDLYKSEENFISCPICTLEGARTTDNGPVSNTTLGAAYQ
jgi:hypothetical protein